MTKGDFITTESGIFHYHKVGGQVGEQVYFCHGNSLSAGTYLPFLKLVAQQGYPVLAGDLRGHGYSTKEKTQKLDDWQMFFKDLDAMVRAVAKPPVIGMGHSIGGFFIYAAAALYPHLFKKLVLIDPIIFPRNIVFLAALIRRLGLADRLTLSKKTRTKKGKFPSKEAVYQHYRGKGMFASWKDEFVRSYVETATEQDTTNTVSLCCDPAFEARIYELVPSNTWEYVPQINVPTLVLRGETSDLFHRNAGLKLEKKMKQTRFEELKGLGHFLIMEDPDAVLARILSFLD